MKIGVDCSSLIQKKTGIGSFASFLLDQMLSEPDGLEFVRYSPAAGRDLRTFERLYWEGIELPQKARRDRVDIVYSPGFSPPPCGKFKKFVTVHDLIGLIYPANTGWASRFYWSHWLPANLKKADRLVASSECTRRDIERFLKIPASRIQVVPLAVRPHFRPLDSKSGIQNTLKKHGIKLPFFISVSTLEPRKNLLTLFRACEKLLAKKRDFSLVVVGKPGGAEADLLRFIEERDLQAQIKMLGYLPDEEIVQLYNAAHGYITVSLYEGFGLPALEAMSSGLTGVVSGNSSLPEVTGESALVVDPGNVDEIASAMFCLASDDRLRAQLAGAAYERSKKFSIQRTAAQMKQALSLK